MVGAVARPDVAHAPNARTRVQARRRVDVMAGDIARLAPTCKPEVI
jgi:hypothetical protein